jgi:hypothetical protein
MFQTLSNKFNMNKIYLEIPRPFAFLQMDKDSRTLRSKLSKMFQDLDNTILKIMQTLRMIEFTSFPILKILKQGDLAHLSVSDSTAG